MGMCEIISNLQRRTACVEERMAYLELKMEELTKKMRDWEQVLGMKITEEKV